MTALLHAHSGLRYLVLLAGLVAAGYYVFALATKKPAGKATRVMGSVFVGLFDLQMLLGFTLVVMGRFYPALIGHFVMMLLAAAVAHGLLVMNRRSAEPGNTLPLAAVVIATGLAVGGILAIGRGPFTMTVGKSAIDASVTGEARAEAKELYATRCAACHGASGKGDGPAAAALRPAPRDLGDPQRQAALSDEDIEKIIVRGGAALGQSPNMPPSPDLEGKPALKALREHVRGFKR